MVAEQDEEPSSSSTLEESKTLTIPSSSTTPENPLALSNDKESLSQDQSKKEEQCDQTSSSQSQDQSPTKKPDKIIPCPRCNSMETKFCYFNNYNVNQPRHFCKNCQRYWTAGGTMRNMPVGAGRRKNKSSSTSQHHHHHHLVIPDRPNALIHHALRPNGTILTFGGQDSSPLSESMASMLKLGEKTPHNCVSNGLIEQGTRVIPPCGCSKNGKQDTNNTTSNDNLICRIEENNNNGNKVTSQSLPPPLVCFTNTSWPYTWNPIPLHSGFPMSFYSPTPPFLPCNPQGTWNLQWLPTPSSIGPDQSSSSISNPNSPLLGKHSRDANEEEQPREEKRSGNSKVGIGIPKTMRIDDPTETAKSSIWGTLGIKNNDKVGLLNVVGGGFFGGFEQLKEGNNQEQGSQISNEGTSSSYLALQANPAAFSRSLSFHENAY